MTKVALAQRTPAAMYFKNVKDGSIQKKNDEVIGGITIEKKSYKLSELSGLQSKFKNITSRLGVFDEKSEGKV